MASSVTAATWSALRRLLELLRSLWAVFWAFLYRRYVEHKRNVVLMDWTELEFCPEEVQNDREAVLCGLETNEKEALRSFSGAVKQDWRALEFAQDLRLLNALLNASESAGVTARLWKQPFDKARQPCKL